MVSTSRQIFDAHQAQAAGRRGGSRGGSQACLQNPFQVGGVQRSLSRKQKSPYQVAHHVVQKPTAPHGIDELVSLPVPARSEDLPNVRCFFFPSPFGIDRGERREIVLSHNQPRYLLIFVTATLLNENGEMIIPEDSTRSRRDTINNPSPAVKK